MSSSTETTTARVLVADDQPGVLEALRGLLTGEGDDPVFVNSTDAVMERLQEHEFDLLLMDLNYTRDTTYGREGPPFVLRGDGTSQTLAEGGMVLGVFPDNHYEQAEIALHPGERVLFYTDGITEARNPEGEEYGEDRLAAAALAVRRATADAIKQVILADVNSFTGGKFEDDATLIVVGLA